MKRRPSTPIVMPGVRVEAMAPPFDAREEHLGGCGTRSVASVHRHRQGSNRALEGPRFSVVARIVYGVISSGRWLELGCRTAHSCPMSGSPIACNLSRGNSAAFNSNV